MPNLNTAETTPSQSRANAAASPVYVSEKQLAERFSVTRSTIRRWRLAAGFPLPIRFSGNCTRWRLADVMAWEQHRAGD